MKVIQIVYGGKSIYGLGDDGTLYRWSYEISKWVTA